MRHFSVFAIALVCVLACQAAWGAMLGSYEVQPYVDITPSFYNTLAYDAWKNPVYSTLSGGGTLTNMQNGTLVGTTNLTPEESIVYPLTAGANGKAVTFLFWFPGTLFSPGTAVDTRIISHDEWGDFYMDTAGNPVSITPLDQGWVTGGTEIPSGGGGSLVRVVTAWAAHDPSDIHGDNYDYNTTVDYMLNSPQLYWRAELRMTNDPQNVVGLSAVIVPDPMGASAGLALLGLVGLGRRRRIKNRN